MKIVRTIWSGIRSLWQRRASKREIDEELRFHLEQRTAENLAAGMSPEEAAREARKRFGNMQRVREECRETHGASFGETTLQDVRFGLRMLRKNPGFTSVAVLSLALGIGANTAIFNLFNSTFLNDVSAREPERLLHLDFGRANQVSYLNYRDLLESGAVADLAGYQNSLVNWHQGDTARAVRGQIVTGNFFEFLGIQAALGRVFVAAETAAESNPELVVLGHSFWQRRLGADPDVVGKTLRLNGHAFTVVGVLPHDYRPVSEFGSSPEMYLPLSSRVAGGLDDRSQIHVELLARLAPGVSRAQATAVLSVAGKRIEDLYPDENPGFGRLWRVYGLTKWERLRQVGSSSLPMFFGLMLAMVGLVLLIACTNVAGLLLARASSRRREIALRLALGATRGRLVRQLLTESSLLAALGGGLGLLCNTWFAALLVRLPLPSALPIEFQPEANARLFCYAFGLAVIAAVLCGLVPALQATRPSLTPALKLEEPQFLHRRFTLRNCFVMGQVALSFVLLITASLFLRSLRHMSTVESGFDTEHTLTVKVNPGGGADAATVFSIEAAIERLESLPGVRSASSAAIIPLSFSGAPGSVRVTGAEDTEIGADLNTVGPRYFETMGIPLRMGRELQRSDVSGAPSVAVINETFAQRHFPQQNPIGRRVRMKAPWMDQEVSWEIVGVVADTKYTLREAPRPQIYWSQAQPPALRRYLTLVVRATASAGALVSPVERAIKELAPSATVEVALMKNTVALYLLPSELAAMILGCLGALGLLLATIGLYGVIAYTVNRRMKEFGVRVALGAPPRAVFGLVLRDGLLLVALGLAMGVAVSLVLTRSLAQFLVSGVSATDPLAFAGTVALLLGVGAIASFWPARRAARVNPIVALRCE